MQEQQTETYNIGSIQIPRLCFQRHPKTDKFVQVSKQQPRQCSFLVGAGCLRSAICGTFSWVDSAPTISDERKGRSRIRMTPARTILDKLKNQRKDKRRIRMAPVQIREPGGGVGTGGRRGRDWGGGEGIYPDEDGFTVHEIKKCKNSTDDRRCKSPKP